MMYRLRLTVLDVSKSLKHYSSTQLEPKYIQLHELTPLAKKTRSLLHMQFESKFFKR